MKSVLKVSDAVLRRSASFSLELSELSVTPHKILGVAGPNGSGKTTLLESLAGIASLDSGHITIMGEPLTNNLRRTKTHLGYVPDDTDWFVSELTAREYLNLLACVYGEAGKPVKMERVDDLADHLHFTAFDQMLATLSHGNKRKVQIIAGIMHEPDLIIIDELRNGLDPIAILAAEHLIRKEAERGAAVIAASHDLWWAQRMTDEILLLADGRRLVQAPTKELIRKYGSLEQLFVKVAYGQMAAR